MSDVGANIFAERGVVPEYVVSLSALMRLTVQGI